MLSLSSYSVATLLVALAMTTAGEDQRYRERQVLDPNTGTWIDQARPEAEGPVGEVDEARRLVAEGDWKAARPILKKWTKANPEDERYLEAMLLLGDTFYLGKDYWNAAERYQEVADNGAGELFHLAQSRCVDCARAFLAGEKRILWGFIPLPAYDDGCDILDRVWQRAPGTRLGEFALKQKADFRYNRGEFEIAKDEYANLIEQYPSGRHIQTSMLRAAESAEANFTGVKFSDRSLIDADVRYRQFKQEFPPLAERESIDARLEGIRQKRADKDLDIAQWYERTKARDAAVFYYRRILADWPDTLAAAGAQARLKALGVEEPVIEAATQNPDCKGGTALNPDHPTRPRAASNPDIGAIAKGQ
jgi:outer membrane protein assembly factor BamD (BamD/ComL family)